MFDTIGVFTFNALFAHFRSSRMHVFRISLTLFQKSNMMRLYFREYLRQNTREIVKNYRFLGSNVNVKTEGCHSAN